MNDIPISDIKLVQEIFDREQAAVHPSLIYRSATEFIFTESVVRNDTMINLDLPNFNLGIMMPYFIFTLSNV